MRHVCAPCPDRARTVIRTPSETLEARLLRDPGRKCRGASPSYGIARCRRSRDEPVARICDGSGGFDVRADRLTVRSRAPSFSSNRRFRGCCRSRSRGKRSKTGRQSASQAVESAREPAAAKPIRNVPTAHRGRRVGAGSRERLSWDRQHSVERSGESFSSCCRSRTVSSDSPMAFGLGATTPYRQREWDRSKRSAPARVGREDRASRLNVSPEGTCARSCGRCPWDRGAAAWGGPGVFDNPIQTHRDVLIRTHLGPGNPGRAWQPRTTHAGLAA